MQQSAGQTGQEAFVRSCSHPSANGTPDTVIVRFCPSESKHTLAPSNVLLDSCIVGIQQKRLYFPEGFDINFMTWPEAKSRSAQQLYHLLQRLHQLIKPGLASVNLYYDSGDGCIAFNKGNRLWYNAFADEKYDEGSQSVRMFDWYVTVCHELAHHFRLEHDEVFSDYLAHIVLQYSQGFYDFCRSQQIHM